MHRLFVLIFLCSVVSVLALAQNPAAEKYQHAVERSQDAALIVSLLRNENSGFPRALIATAQVIAVFPHLAREDMLVRKYLHGYGVVSARVNNHWSLPAFYQFESAPRKLAGSSQENLAVILVFLNNDAVLWFDKDKSEFKGERAAVIGPVNGQNQNQSGNKVLAYAYYNGKLNPKIDSDFFNDFILDQDNNINTPVYGMKARDVLAGKQIDT